jgi:hypothetical protein
LRYHANHVADTVKAYISNVLEKEKQMLDTLDSFGVKSPCMLNTLSVPDH